MTLGGAPPPSQTASGPRDLYEVLGVPRTADRDEIRRAYRTAALACHPDRNQGSGEAEERFKELADAFRTLSDAEARSLYDRLGHDGLRRGPAIPDLSDALHVFVTQFRAFVRDELGQRPGERAAAGELSTKLFVTLSEVATGATREVPLPCARCGGTGAEPAAAEGPGPCMACVGTGTDASGGTVLLRIPPGVATGDRVRSAHDPAAAPGAGRRGPMVVATVEVEDDPRFVRAGRDLVVELALPAGLPGRLAGDGASGDATEWEVPTPTGSARVRVPAGGVPGGVLRMAGLGLPSRNGGEHGDLIVKLTGGAAAANGTASPGPLRALALRARAGARARLSAGIGARIAAVEGRFDAFLLREGRPVPPPYGVQLARVQRDIAHASRSQIEGLSRLETGLLDGVARLEGVRMPVPLRSPQDVLLAAQGAGEARDGLMATVILLVLSLALGALNVLALEGALALLVPDPSVFAIPLLLRADPLLPGLITVGAFGAGVLAQALEIDGERGVPPGVRGGTTPARPPAAKAGPYTMAVAAVAMELLLFASLADAVDLPGLLGIDPETLLSQFASVAVPLAGLAIPLGLMSLGSGFWFNLRRLSRSRARGSVGRALDRHLGHLRALPEDATALEARVAEAASTLHGLRKSLAESLAQARQHAGMEDAHAVQDPQGTAAGEGANATSAPLPPAEVEPPPRSAEEILAGLAVGTLGGVLLAVLLALLHRQVAAGLLALVGAGAGAASVELAAWAVALAVPVLAWLVRDALFGSSHTAVLTSALPDERPRHGLAALAGALLLVVVLGVGWLAPAAAPTVGQPVLWVVVPATAAVLLSFNLDVWIVLALKSGYLALLGAAWLGLGAVRALLGADRTA